MSVKMQTFAIMCAFNCKRVQSCVHIHAVTVQAKAWLVNFRAGLRRVRLCEYFYTVTTESEWLRKIINRHSLGVLLVDRGWRTKLPVVLPPSSIGCAGVHSGYTPVVTFERCGLESESCPPV